MNSITLIVKKMDELDKQGAYPKACFSGTGSGAEAEPASGRGGEPAVRGGTLSAPAPHRKRTGTGRNRIFGYSFFCGVPFFIERIFGCRIFVRGCPNGMFTVII